MDNEDEALPHDGQDLLDMMEADELMNELEGYTPEE